MKKRVSHIIALLAVLALVSCSTKKNTAFTRFYHSFTTRYNVYFNGIENYKEQIKTMENEYEDNFTDLIYMHPAQAYANPKDPQPTGSFDRTIEKCQKAIQLHSIKKKPRRNSKKMSDPKYRDYLKRDEFNPYIHNAWRLMGQAQYYKGEFLEAAATFLYISRHFTWMPDLVAESKLWQARCYIALGWLYEAEDILQKINNDKLPESQNNWFATVNADYLIHKGEYQKAIPFLETAIKSAPSKRQRIRLTFLLGQLYEKTQDPARAYQTFGQVISMNPPYRTEFNARIKQTEVFSGKNIDKEVKKLTRMASRDRNKEYLDQIYYAIGNLYLSRKDTLKAMENYRLANQKSTRNGIEKAICQVTLGDLYFDRREYVDAQPCYAEALPQLKEDFPRYDLLERRSTVLDELVVYAQNVELQDSLQNLAAMSEEERNKAIQKIIDDLIKKEKEEAENLKREEYLAQQQGPQFNSSNAAKNNATLISGDKSWYFYNKTMVSAGKTEFQRIWGSRKLEDDWRRRNKSGFSMSDFAEKTEGGGGEEGGPEFDENGMPVEEIPDSAETAAADDPHKPEFYLKQIPMTPEALETSNEVVAEGLFNMGLILKNKLEDYPAAIPRKPLPARRLLQHVPHVHARRRRGDRRSLPRQDTVDLPREPLRPGHGRPPLPRQPATHEHRTRLHLRGYLRRLPRKRQPHGTRQPRLHGAEVPALAAHAQVPLPRRTGPCRRQAVRPVQGGIEKPARALSPGRCIAAGLDHAQRGSPGTPGGPGRRQSAGHDLEGPPHQRHHHGIQRLGAGHLHPGPQRPARAPAGLCHRQRIVQPTALRRGQAQLHQLRR